MSTFVFWVAQHMHPQFFVIYLLGSEKLGYIPSSIHPFSFALSLPKNNDILAKSNSPSPIPHLTWHPTLPLTHSLLLETNILNLSIIGLSHMILSPGTHLPCIASTHSDTEYTVWIRILYPHGYIVITDFLGAEVIFTTILQDASDNTLLWGTHSAHTTCWRIFFFFKH